jgi:transposase
MSKGTYRAVEIKSVNLEKLAKAVGGGRLVFAVDVGKEVPYAQLVNDKGEGLVKVKWKQPSQTMEVVAWLGRLGAEKVEAVMEPSGTYGDALRGRLWAAGYEVYRVSPKKVHDLSEVHDGVPSKHDAKDAAIIGELHLKGSSELWPLRPEQDRELIAAVGLMDLHQEAFGRGLGKLEAQLARHFPELGALLELGSATMLMLLERFGSASEIAQQHSEARELMRKVGGHLLTAEKIEAVLEAARHSTGLNPVQGEREMLQRLCAELRHQRSEAQRAERWVLSLCREDEALSAMSTVVGKSSAVALQAAMGSPKQYQKAGQLEKAMGLNLKENSSGKRQGKRHITKRGNSMARRLMFLAALRKVKDDAVVRAWYERRVHQEGGNKLLGLVAVMRKLVRALWHLGVHGGVFDARRLFDVRRLQLQGAAAAGN